MEIGTKAGWREFVDRSYERPVLIAVDELNKLSFGDRASYNESRLRYSQAGAFVKTPQFRDVQRAVRQRVMANTYKQVGKLGVIVSGEPGQGKTTTLLQIGKEHERRRRETDHASAGDGKIPVVYVAVPAQCSAKALLSEFARFLGLPVLPRMTYGQLLDMVANALQACSTELILIDDVHHLMLRRQLNLEASDMLKQLSERCSGTFVYAGIAVESTGMLTDVRAGQISKRFELHTAHPFRVTSEAGKVEWSNLLLALEDSLCLLNQTPRDILEAAKALHVLCNGEIGMVKDFLQIEMIQAIEDGTEKLDVGTFKRMAETKLKAKKTARR